MTKKMKLVIVIVMILQIGALLGMAAADPEETTYYFGDTYMHKVELDNGFSAPYLSIDKDDPHYGWSLGEFKLTGWTQRVEDDGKLIFLKNAGDTVRLSFVLAQNIKKLNDNEDLYISEDIDGYDKYFKIDKTNFGHGMLIIQHTDYQNHTEKPQMYANYLSGVEVGADTFVDFFEEGDYEVCLDYEIGRDRLVKDKYYNYEIYFKFSVRNGNCMFFPRDDKTGAELPDKSFTKNGFVLDLAKTRYLDVSIKKEILVDGALGVTEDTRFNKPAKDGERFTDEGIYTIKATNKYTKENTIKTIYVGENNVLKAYVVSGRSIAEIYQMLEQGYKIAEDGSFIEPPKPTATPTSTPIPTATPTPEPTSTPTITPTVTSPVASATPSESETEQGEMVADNKNDSSDSMTWVIAISSAIALAILACVFVLVKKNHRSSNADVPEAGILLPDPEEAPIDEAKTEVSTENDKEGE